MHAKHFPIPVPMQEFITSEAGDNPQAAGKTVAVFF